MAFGNAVGEGFNNPEILEINKLIVFGTGEGVFVYSGTPALGNPPIAWMTNSAADPFGNAVTPVVGVGGSGSSADIVMIPGTGGSASELQFQVASPAQSNVSNIAASGGTPQELLISGPAGNTTNQKDWVQIQLVSNGGTGTSAQVIMNFIASNGAVTHVASYGSYGFRVNTVASFENIITIAETSGVTPVSGVGNLAVTTGGSLVYVAPGGTQTTLAAGP
jgi:hypothetical protein